MYYHIKWFRFCMYGRQTAGICSFYKDAFSNTTCVKWTTQFKQGQLIVTRLYHWSSEPPPLAAVDNCPTDPLKPRPLQQWTIVPMITWTPAPCSSGQLYHWSPQAPPLAAVDNCTTDHMEPRPLRQWTIVPLITWSPAPCSSAQLYHWSPQAPPLAAVDNCTTDHMEPRGPRPLQQWTIVPLITWSPAPCGSGQLYHWSPECPPLAAVDRHKHYDTLINQVFWGLKNLTFKINSPDHNCDTS